VARENRVAALAYDWVPDDDELTDDRLHPSHLGYQRLAAMLADSLVGGTPTLQTHAAGQANEALRSKILAKDQLFFHRYRPQNETYLFLFRKHEQGNNAVEIPQFDPLIEAADQAIWQAAGQSAK
jgi:hypothetical protein